MLDGQPRSTERVKRGAKNAKRGVGEIGKGVGEVAADVVENVKDSVRHVIATGSEPRDKVVMVRVSKDSLDRMDDLIEAGVVGSRSEAADYLINEGIRARRSFFDEVAIKVEQIRKAKEELKRLSDEERAAE